MAAVALPPAVPAVLAEAASAAVTFPSVGDASVACFSAEARKGEVLHGCFVCDSVAGAGVGLRTTRSFSKGDVLYRTLPLGWMQEGSSACAAPACIGCGMMVGGDLRSILKTCVAASSNAEAGRPDLKFDWGDLEDSGLLDDGRFRLRDPVPCPRGSPENEAFSCSAVFCSIACRDKQMKSGHHRLTCGDASPLQRAAWKAFRLHSGSYTESFELAGIVIAQAVAETTYSNMCPEQAMRRYTGFYAQPWQELLREGEDRAEWVERRLDTLRTSLELLTDAIGEATEAAGLGALLTEDSYARAVGMIDLTSKDMERPHPRDAGLKSAVGKLPLKAQIAFGKVSIGWMRTRSAAEDAQEAIGPDSPEISEDEDGEDDAEAEESEEAVPELQDTVDLVSLSKRVAKLPMLPSFEGFGLVDIVALTNHSCDPNVDVVPMVYTAEVAAIAMRDIAEGEEVLMSYVDEGQSRKARQHHLLGSYGFRCRCTKCEADLVAESEKKAKAKAEEGKEATTSASPE
eukprot:TRINITY_DN14419_c0_g1_i2.p1 TRINITY_DN14419_c0_g1~~TRINITY_DN14419_c0_g1_i2.p1  ORF type:complete len:528 (-),score=111.41 TRINITY_DN14419_c0_g1_i2:79-1623(-)